MTSTTQVNETASICGHQAKFVDVKGLRTRYYDVGSGDPMVLCHGGNPTGTSSANTWTLNLSGLGKKFRVLAADRLACGMTDNPMDKKDYTMKATVEHMYAFMETVGAIKDVHMVGQSTGAFIAARIALEHPDIVKSLIIVDSGTLGPEIGDKRQRRRTLFSAIPRDKTSPTYFADNYRYHMSIMSFTTDHVTDEWIEAAAYMRGLPKALQTIEDLGEADVNYFRKTLPPYKEETHRWIREGRLKIPTLLYWGRNDFSAIFEVGLATFEMISQKNPKTRMIIVNHAGHFHYREYPEEFNRNVINFIEHWTE